ncbi:MAG: replication-associated recombination protein A [Actinobacteria bacterium]|nr:replication-associated recombination protein A [Actinomycetota bacterium]
MRPRTFDELVGHEAVLASGRPIRTLLERGEPISLILWGPPGSGKTSVAHVVAGQLTAAWEQLSAVTAGVKDVREVIQRARDRLRANGRRTVLFLDEIHRFNKAQQDALLPVVEDGTLVLIGATTENPFFEVNAPLLSRCELVRLEALTDDDVRAIVAAALTDTERGLAGRAVVEPDAMDHLVALADGDARAALNTLELGVAASEQDRDGAGTVISLDALEAATRRLRYDRAADQHYDIVSAFIKSMRGTDPDAAVYYLLRMLEAGEDPRFIARRMVIFASEDVGLADDGALPTAVAAFEALDRVGLPEAEYNLVHAAIRLATAPKSASVKRAMKAGHAAVEEAGNAPVPAHLRDSHYPGAARLGHGTGYLYPHDHPEGYVAQQYLPDELVGRRLYDPSPYGDEGSVQERLARLWQRSTDEGGSTT